MPDHEPSAPNPKDMEEAAKRSQDAGIADESAAYKSAIDREAPASLDEGDPATKDDGSGTSETD